MKLNQFLAVEKDLRARAERAIGEASTTLQTPALFGGMSRTYEPKDDDGPRVPGEDQIVQARVEDALALIREPLGDHLDNALARDRANLQAKGTLYLDGVTYEVPTTFLLFLEKNLVGLRALVSKAPTLATDRLWDWDGEARVHRSTPVVTQRTEKKTKPIVVHPPTVEHPAQCHIVNVDVHIGDWTTQILSGAMAPSRRDAIVERIDGLIREVKQALAEANTLEVPRTEESFGGALMGAILGT